MRFFSIFALLFALTLTACDSNDPVDQPDPVNLEVQTMADVVADPATVPPGGGPPTSSGRYTLVDISEGTVVLSWSEEDPAIRQADSLSANWDIGFNGTNIIANATPDSDGGIQIIEDLFQDVLEAPTSGYADMLTGGSGNGWYNYAGPPTHLITPIPGRVIILRTAEGNYAKIRILSYYEDAPEEPDAFEDADRHYTFEYVYQPDGSTGFETTTGSN